MFHEDFAQQNQVVSSSAIPVRTTRKASLQMVRRVGPFNLEAGALWSGRPRVGDTFQIVDEDLVDAQVVLDPTDVRQDTVKHEDTFGFKGKLTWQQGRWNWYGQGGWMGLVADGGPTAIPTFTGWELKDSGSGNQVNALTGAAYTMGNWQIGPNLLWQKPIVGPMPNGEYLAGTAGRVRNVIDDPFAVRGNRETTGGELMVTYDPTPATWMWAWDSDLREDAKLAASIGLSVRRHHTSADGGLLVSAEGLVYGFAGATPERDLRRSSVVRERHDRRGIGHGGGRHSHSHEHARGPRAVRREREFRPELPRSMRNGPERRHDSSQAEGDRDGLREVLVESDQRDGDDGGGARSGDALSHDDAAACGDRG